MSKLPDELRRYLASVHEANERIVAQKKRQLDPNLRDDDLPWLVTENEQMRLQITGFGGKPDETTGEIPNGALKPEEVDALLARLVILSADWNTWQDVFDAAEKMNSEIEKVLD